MILLVVRVCIMLLLLIGRPKAGLKSLIVITPADRPVVKGGFGVDGSPPRP